jgi:prepilin peptidase CpaA
MTFEMLLERSPLHLAPLATLTLLSLLFLAAGFDIVQRKVPNVLIIGGLAIALMIALMSGWPGLGRLASGSIAALIILLPAYASGMMGAGDVKLISVVGGFLGFHHFLFALLCIFIAGGILSALFFWRPQLTNDGSGVPYAVAVLGGMSAYLVLLR